MFLLDVSMVASCFCNVCCFRIVLFQVACVLIVGVVPNWNLCYFKRRCWSVPSIWRWFGEVCAAYTELRICVHHFITQTHIYEASNTQKESIFVWAILRTHCNILDHLDLQSLWCYQLILYNTSHPQPQRHVLHSESNYIALAPLPSVFLG